MDGDERGEPREVAGVMRKQILQPVREHRGRDIGVMHLPAFNRKPLNQFVKLLGNESGVLQDVKSRPERGKVPENGRVIRRYGLCGRGAAGHSQILAQDLNAEVKIRALLAPFVEFSFGSGL